ncbi:hypothetical protein [Azospirillum sp.]|uniref:hypothetical protein n=1 Tax=Azospirillum sp. TaxID=34012 RepID=UPI002D46C911|nr:hypothetical protein [Azospirillum sp.]HYD69476.1 hypothetical protein [Azospirillum sp.]
MGRILYYCEQGRITGGIKVSYRHVDTLRRNGFDAAIVHKHVERPDWFAAPDVPILSADEVVLSPRDVVVIGEDSRFTLRGVANTPARKVLLCQNHYYVAFGLHGARDFSGFGIEAALSTGDVVTAFLRRRFPGLPVATAHLAIDPALYRPRPKQLRIAAIPRKRPHEMEYIRDLLRAEHPEHAGVRWAILKDAAEGLVARVMGESAVFLSLARLEGIGLTGLEAMASGCAVTGFLGDGGREYASAENGWWADGEDLDSAVRQLAACLTAVRGGTAETRIAAGRATAARYTLEREERELVAFWRNFLT